MNRPLLVIDGDNFAHRSYHALPKTIRRAGNRGGGAIVGFANFLLRLYESERPRAVLVGWDTLGAPTYRQELFPAYQGGREFDDEIVEQLDVLPEFVAACGFANAKAAGLRGRRFPRRRGRRRGSGAAVRCSSRAATATPSARLGAHDDPAPGQGRRDGAHRPGRGARTLRGRAAPGARFHRVARRPVGPAARRPRRRPEGRGGAVAQICDPRRRLRRRAAGGPGRSSCASTAGSRRWTRRRRSPPSPTRPQPGPRPPRSPASGSSTASPTGCEELAARQTLSRRRERVGPPRCTRAVRADRDASN